MSFISIGDFSIDAAINEDHAFDSDVTDHPVETGADVTDNIRAKPITVTLDCIVSDTPIGKIVAERQDFGFASLATSAAGGGDGGSSYRPSSDAYAVLLAIRDAREPVTITTSLQVFENMALVSLSVPRNAQNGEALRFKATFKQIKFVTNLRTTVRVAVPRAAAKKALGNKPATENKNVVIERSVGVHLFDAKYGDGNKLIQTYAKSI